MADLDITFSPDGRLYVGILAEAIAEADELLMKEVRSSLQEYDDIIRLNRKNIEDERGQKQPDNERIASLEADIAYDTTARDDLKRRTLEQYKLDCFSVNENTLYSIRKMRNTSKKSSYQAVCKSAESKLLDWPDKYKGIHTGETIRDNLIELLEKRKVKTEMFRKAPQDGYEPFVNALIEEAKKTISDLEMPNGNSDNMAKESDKMTQRSNDYNTHILMLGYEGFEGSIHQVVEGIQKRFPNPIVMTTDFRPDKKNQYDLFYCIIDSYPPENSEAAICGMPPKNAAGLPIVRVYVKDTNEMALEKLRKLCMEKGIAVKPFYDANTYKYDLLNDLEAIILSKEAYKQEYIENKHREIERLLDKKEDVSLQAFDFKTYERAVDIYGRQTDENKGLEPFIDALICDKVKIANSIAQSEPDQAEKIFEQLYEMARTTGIHMEVLLDYARFLKGKADDKSVKKAIKIAEELEKYYAYKDEENGGRADLFYFLASTFEDGKEDAKAFGYYEKAKETGKLTKNQMVEIISRMAKILWRTNQFIKAQSYIDENMDFVKSAYEEDKVGYAQAYAQLLRACGGLAHARLDLEKAIECYKIAIDVLDKKEEICKSRDDDDQIEKARALNNIGIYNRKMGMYNATNDYYDRNIKIREDLYLKSGKQKYAFTLSIGLSNKAYFLWTAERDRFERDGKFHYVPMAQIVRLYERVRNLKEEGVGGKENNNYYLSMLRFYVDYACYLQRIDTPETVDEHFQRARDFAEKLLRSEDNAAFDVDIAKLNYYEGKSLLDRLGDQQVPEEKSVALLTAAYKVFEKDFSDGYNLEYYAYVTIALLKCYVLLHDTDNVSIYYGKAVEVLKWIPDQFAEKERMIKEVEELKKQSKG